MQTKVYARNTQPLLRHAQSTEDIIPENTGVVKFILQLLQILMENLYAITEKLLLRCLQIPHDRIL